MATCSYGHACLAGSRRACLDADDRSGTKINKTVMAIYRHGHAYTYGHEKLWPHIVVAIYNCGHTQLWPHIVVATTAMDTMQLWPYIVMATYSHGHI